MANRHKNWGTATKTAIVSLALLGSAVLAAHLVPDKLLADVLPAIDLERSIPSKFTEWKIDTSLSSVLPDPTQQALLDKLYNSMTAVTYVGADGYRIMFTAAYGKKQLDDTIQLHNPEVCYAAQGFQISQFQKNSIQISASKSLLVHELIATAPGRPEVVTYWIVVGEKIANTRGEQKIASLKYGFEGYIPDGLLMRVSSIDSNKQNAIDRHRKFISDLYAETPTSLKKRYFGTP